MAKLLITGSTGFIGRNLIPMLEKGTQMEVILPYIGAPIKIKNVQNIECNLLDNKSLTALIKTHKPTHLLHLAWGMEASNYNLPNNFDWLSSSIKLLDLFREHGGKRAVMVGTGVEYNWDFGVCQEDKTPVSYDNLYSGTKNILRQFSELYCKTHEVSFVWPRLFFVYGPHESDNRLVPHIIVKLLKGEQAEIRSGDLYRDYVYVKDVSRILLSLVESEGEGIVNIGTGNPVNLGDIAYTIANKIGRPDLLKINNTDITRRKTVVADIHKLQHDMGFRTEYSIEDGLAETIDWWKNKLKR